MSGDFTRRASLAQIRQMKNEGTLSHDARARAEESLGEDFWAKAKVQRPGKPRSVHLRIDPEVFDFFYEQAEGKGHLTHMQNVLRAYAQAHKLAGN